MRGGLLEPLIRTATRNRALYSTRDGEPAEEARNEIGNNDRFLDLWSLEPIKKSPVLQ